MGVNSRKDTLRPFYRKINNMNLYIQIPKTITYKDLLKKRYILSAKNYQSISIQNKNLKRIKELVIEKPQIGREVGSFSYVNKSPFYFLRTKALQTSFFLPVLNNTECAVPILPKAFKDFELRKGDILLAKDANVGDASYLNTDLPNFMISSGIVKLRFSEEVRFYIFAFMKSNFFRNQIDLMISRGATLKHAKTLWLDAVIPFPNQKNKEEVMNFVSILTKAIIRKESEIKEKYNKIMWLIDEELKKNQKLNKFAYVMPNLKNLQETLRLDAGIFCKDYKEKQFLIENYIYGTDNIFNDFDFKRGQNLQVSQIGKSIYSEEYKPGFYKLVRPLNLSDFGTVEKYEYLGNSKKLQTIDKGEILLSAEGTIGKFCVFIDVDDKTITNIHGIIISKKNKKDNVESIFLGLFLGYLRNLGVLDYISVGGQGGSLAQRYWNYIKIPRFPRGKKEELAQYYYKPVNYNPNKLNVENFEAEDIKITKEAGIWQLDKQIKQIKQKLNEIFHKIIMDEEVKISFNFLT